MEDTRTVVEHVHCDKCGAAHPTFEAAAMCNAGHVRAALNQLAADQGVEL